MTERQVPYEFKVIVLVSEDTWPHEIQDAIWVLLDEHFSCIQEVVGVEEIRDGY